MYVNLEYMLIRIFISCFWFFAYFSYNFNSAHSMIFEHKFMKLSNETHIITEDILFFPHSFLRTFQMCHSIIATLIRV